MIKIKTWFKISAQIIFAAFILCGMLAYPLYATGGRFSFWVDPHGAKNLLLGGLFALLVTTALVVVLKLLNRIHLKARLWLETTGKQHLPTIRIQKIELIPADRLFDLCHALLNAFSLAAMLFLFYIYIPVLFSFFPWTRGLSDILFGYLTSPITSVFKALVNYIPNLFFIGVISACVHYFLKLLKLIAMELKQGRIQFPNFPAEWAEPTYQILRFIVLAFALVIIFPYLPGSGSPAFQGISVFVGVLFSFGSSSAISNIIAGIILTYMRPFKLGDRVKIADTMGDVTEKSLLVTRVRTIKNVDITIPNAQVLNSHIINYSSLSNPSGLILHTTVTIGYDAPWRKVHELLHAAAAAVPEILKDPAPFVLQTQLGDFSVSYELNAYTQQPEKMAVIYSLLHQNIQDQFHQAGVEILSPIYNAVRDGNTLTLPQAFRKPGADSGGA